MEYEARHLGANDIFLLQALAEVAYDGGKANILLVVLMHQTFEQYSKSLGETLKNEWVNVRIYAVTSLGKLNDVKAVPALIDVMKNRSENELVRAGAAAALGVLRDQRALLPLRELIMKAEELGELEDTALKAFKKIMAANWQNVPGAINKKMAVAK